MPREQKEDNEQKWRRYEDKIRAKRDINTNRKRKFHSDQVPKLRRDELIVQRLTSTVSGKAQKFSRIGAREFVPYPHDDLTVRGIKDACLFHFGKRVTGMECDILAGEQGPSCKTLEQISNLNKVIHVRFVSCGKESVHILDNETSDDDDSFTPTIPKRKKAGNSINSFILPPNDKTKPSSMPSFSIGMSETQKEEKAIHPKSLSISQMLKLGKLVKSPPGRKILRLFHFDLANMTWSDIPTTVECEIEDEPFNEGGFRSAHRATISTGDFSKQKWVVKKFLPTTVPSINEEPAHHS